MLWMGYFFSFSSEFPLNPLCLFAFAFLSYFRLHLLLSMDISTVLFHCIVTSAVVYFFSFSIIFPVCWSFSSNNWRAVVLASQALIWRSTLTWCSNNLSPSSTGRTRPRLCKKILVNIFVLFILSLSGVVKKRGYLFLFQVSFYYHVSVNFQ